MKRILSFLTPLLLTIACVSNAPYLSENFKNQISSHERIAVLPFVVNFNAEYKNNFGRGGRSTRPEYWREQERLAGLDMQKEFFVSAARQVEKGKFEKVVQDFITTNKYLESSGVKIFEIPSMDKGEICRILNVDAVVWGETDIVVNPPFGYSSAPGGATTIGSLFDGRTGDMLWQKKIVQRPSNRMDTPKSLGARTAQQLAKLLPY